jgi:hypothetical protein
MKCNVCDYDYKNKFDQHDRSKSHIKILEMTRKLEEANLDKEKERLEKELSIKREQKLKKENIKVTKDREKVEKEFLNEKRNRDNKIKELESLIERQSRKSLDFENLKTNHNSSVPFYSNLIYTPTKVRDSSIESNTTETQKMNISELGDDITKKLKGKQVNLTIYTESISSLSIEKQNSEEYKSNLAKENESKENVNNLTCVSNESKSIIINQIENKKTHDLNINDIFEEDKEIIKYNFKIFDFKNNESIKTRNRRLFILIKKSNAYDKVLKYMFCLKTVFT